MSYLKNNTYWAWALINAVGHMYMCVCVCVWHVGWTAAVFGGGAM